MMDISKDRRRGRTKTDGRAAMFDSGRKFLHSYRIWMKSLAPEEVQG